MAQGLAAAVVRLGGAGVNGALDALTASSTSAMVVGLGSCQRVADMRSMFKAAA